MKKILAFAPALLLSACHMSYGDSQLKNGSPIPTTASKIANFTGVSAIGPDNISFTTGPDFTISATGNAEDLNKLAYIIKDGKLIVGRAKSDLFNNDGHPVNIAITAPSLSSIEGAGSGAINADHLAGDKVSLSTAGSGSITANDVQAKSFDASIAGSGDMHLGGKVDSAKYSIAGSGSISAKPLANNTAKISVVGSGNAELTVTGTADADIAGSGNITVTGGAKCKSSSVGSGKLVCE